MHLMLTLKCVELYLHCPIHLRVWCLINDRHIVVLAWVVCKSRSPLCSPSLARTRKSWTTDCPGYWRFWTLASYHCGSSVCKVLHITLLVSSVLRWQLPERLFTVGVYASNRISNPLFRLLYTATFNRTWTVPSLTCHGEETVLCCVRWEGHAAFNFQCFLVFVVFFSVPLTSVSRLSEFAVRKYFELKLRSRINPYFMSLFFHKS
jgi:hypothetical protein